ncbi:DUF1573 domain-containing protein [Raineya orbicola]|uniref:DUF1573 domain-containing protein n=1 Tax=Raineya orbicola TaxID=2016530 RepID=A0A2N3IE87_9BACT|nr:DUF1573 domain-containing protein [Raineya orbicola]PKQ68595.1 hypothetical protein Rain11_1662 [Raineya orbicola]
MNKWIFSLIVGIFFQINAFSQDSTQVIRDTIFAPDAPRITFTSNTFHFGNLKMGNSVSHTFEFTNTGKKDLKILSVQTSCNCTTTLLEKKIIRPGEKGRITVIYTPKPNQKNEQKKVILVISNAINKEELLYMTGFVEP